MSSHAMALESAPVFRHPGLGTKRLRGMAWIGGVLSLIAALLLRNPFLLQWRPAVMLLVFGVPPIVLVLLHRRGLRTPATRSKWALRLLWLSALAVAATQQGEFLWHQHQVLLSDDAISRQLGAHLVVGYTDTATIKSLAEKGLIGGIFISTHNVRDRSAAAIRAEIAALQAVRQAAGLPPLIVATDQEGGIVSRLSPPLIRMPSLADVIATAKADEIEDLAFAYGEKHGHDLAALGINVNFAPLADLSSPDRRQRLDFRSQIGRRAIDDDPARVSPAVIAYAHGLEASGVRATLKHFPGLGRVTADTHVFPATLATDERELETSDWIPFRQGLQATRSLLMVGHATLTSVDDQKPASLSRKLIHNIVRQRWGHDGILITDDLSMGAVVRHGLCQAGVEVINAGIDLLLVSYDVEQYYTVFHCLQHAARANTIDLAMFGASQRRLGGLHQNLSSTTAGTAKSLSF